MTEHILENLLDLKKVDGHHFEAPAIPDTRGRTFGGQFLGQALRAAQLTVDSDRSIHSLHSYFLRPGNVNQTTSYKVETVRDGRGFSVREVRAYQSNKELFRCTLSFATPHPGLEYDGPKSQMPHNPKPSHTPTTSFRQISDQSKVTGTVGDALSIFGISTPPVPLLDRPLLRTN